MEAATAVAGQEGLQDCISITSSFDGLTTAIAERFKSGDNVWDGQLVGDDIVRIGFYKDKTHRRVF